MAYYNIEDRYKHDATFNRVVDQMRSLLSMYHVTPSELREASMLAAMMHECENVRPLYMFKYDGKGNMLAEMPVQWGYYPKYPAMFGGFGGIDPIGCVAPKTPVECDCTKELGSAPKHCHIFRSSGYGYDVCNDCGISDVYYNWAYSKKS